MLIPLLGSIYLWLIDQNNNKENIGLQISLLPLLLIVFIVFIGFKPNYNINQFLNIYINCDGLSLIFILLTVIIIPLSILTANKNEIIIIILLITETLLIGAFSVLDLLSFFILFESVLIPMYFLIGKYGTGLNIFKIQAAYQFFIYTLSGSVLLLISILLIYSELGSLNYYIIINSLSENIQLFIFPLIFIAFAVKIPLFPFHLWLPKAHCEAPTSGSVILAALLLKLGGYGMIRWLIPITPIGTEYYRPIILTITSIGIIYTSLTCLRQIDIKKIIAYASVSHMSIIVFGIFTLNNIAIIGSIYQMITHGLVSAGLFITIGNIYNRYSIRILKYYRGLVSVMPIYSVILFILTLGNISVPLTSNFIGEFLIFTGSFQVAPYLTIFNLISIIIGAGYGIWLYNRLIFGQLSNYLIKFKDLTRIEYYTHIPLILLILLLGVYPNIIIYLISNIFIL